MRKVTCDEVDAPGYYHLVALSPISKMHTGEKSPPPPVTFASFQIQIEDGLALQAALGLHTARHVGRKKRGKGLWVCLRYGVSTIVRRALRQT